MARTPWIRAAILALGSIAVLWAAGCGRPTLDLPPAPTFEITGTLTRDGAPAGNASIHLTGSPLGVVVRNDGTFRLTGVRAGRYSLAVVYLGYRSSAVAVTVPGGSAEGVDLEMRPDPRHGAPLAGDDPQIQLTYRVSGGS